MRSSVVGNSTHRPLSTHEVQGFAIADPVVPVVFVNSGDYKAAQIFTFAHELAHIWIGQSAITNPDETEVDTNRIEAFCNRVAVAVLLPANEFAAAWDDLHPDSRRSRVRRRRSPNATEEPRWRYGAETIGLRLSPATFK